MLTSKKHGGHTVQIVELESVRINMKYIYVSNIERCDLERYSLQLRFVFSCD